MADIPIIGERFEDRLARELAADVFGHGPEARVRELRASVLGEEPVRFLGLLEQAERTPAEPRRG